jgi:serine palmitoyltransferase
MTESRVNSDTKLSVVMYTLTLLQYILAVMLGLVHDGIDQLKRVTSNWMTGKRNTESDLLSYTATFYERRLFSLMRDCWHRPIYSSPSSWIAVNGNHWCLNLGSYNYLGFGDNLDKQLSIDAIHHFGAASCSFRSAIGTNQLHLELELEIAKFVGKPSALICSMGFATNSAIIPVVCGPRDLIISDSLNHRSIVDGARLAGSKVQTFKHNGTYKYRRIDLRIQLN